MIINKLEANYHTLVYVFRQSHSHLIEDVKISLKSIQDRSIIRPLYFYVKDQHICLSIDKFVKEFTSKREQIDYLLDLDSTFKV